MQKDGHVRLLPLHVANKIAAGEVVERPASVLKELMENALDAGATRIEVTVTAGGRKLVSVRDDGCGMCREDALLSLERQATSKIRDVDDIERIDTLGVRGEAAPATASASRCTLTTRRPDEEAGTRLVVNAGILAEVADCGAPPGTCVEVRDLFCNVPARRKFLRAFATEEAHIRATFTVHALAHPDVGFTLILDGRETYRFPPGATLEERIRDLFGAPFAEALLPVGGGTAPADAAQTSTNPVRVHGYVERPANGSTLRRDQFIFVNGRPATAACITYALREAYPRAREESRPAVVLFIDLPPMQVDVNVHPAKREVRFRRPADVRDAVIATVSAALAPPPAAVPPAAPIAEPSSSGTLSAIQAIPADVPVAPAQSLVPATTAPTVPTPPAAPSFAVPFSTPVQTSFHLPVQPRPAETAPAPCVEVVDADAERTPKPAPQPTALWRWFTFLAQMETGYVLLETDAGLVVLDPRAARARIAYERVLDRRDVFSQPLLIPETVQLPPADSARIRAFRTDLEAAGFTLEEFGRDIWKVDAVPNLVNGVGLQDLLASIATDIAENGARRGSNRWRDELVAKSVARAFAGSPGKLTRDAAIQLVNELAATRMPYICPRNRPIMVLYSNNELSRKFGR